MEIVKGSNEQIVASEAFTPVLSGEYIERYSTLLEKLSSVLPAKQSWCNQERNLSCF